MQVFGGGYCGLVLCCTMCRQPREDPDFNLKPTRSRICTALEKSGAYIHVYIHSYSILWVAGEKHDIHVCMGPFGCP